jgi:hypothetical protein
MQEAHDFGTGLRAHLGLDAAQLVPTAEPAAPHPQPLAELVEVEVGEPETAGVDALAAREAELHERERSLAVREAALASRAGSLLAAAQALYDDVMGAGTAPLDDELARLRQRKSVA